MLSGPVLFDDWTGLARVVIVGVAAYVALIVMLRVSGSRALAKLNAFDLVVTIALGSTLSAVLLSSSVALAEGLTAMAMLLTMQWVVARLSVASARVRRLVRAEPTLVYHHGFLEGAMRAQRVTAEELRQAARGEGHASVEQVSAIVLESDGSLSVLAEAPPQEELRRSSGE